MFRLFVAVPLLAAVVGIRQLLSATKRRKQVNSLETAAQSPGQKENETAISVEPPASGELFCMGSVEKPSKREQRLSRASWNRGNNNTGATHTFGQSKHSAAREEHENDLVDMATSATVESGFGERPRSEPIGRPSPKRSRK